MRFAIVVDEAYKYVYGPFPSRASAIVWAQKNVDWNRWFVAQWLEVTVEQKKVLSGK